MAQTAVYIDGGYLKRLLEQFGKPRIDYEKFTQWACNGDTLFRAYYYDCLPYQSANPSDDERRRVSQAQKFHTALRRLARFTVREGRLEFRGMDASNGHAIFQQKRVDLLLGIDMASLASKRRVDAMTLIAGDSDFIPAVEYAREEGIIIRLAHGPQRTYHQDLWDAADERLEIYEAVLQGMIRNH